MNIDGVTVLNMEQVMADSHWLIPIIILVVVCLVMFFVSMSVMNYRMGVITGVLLVVTYIILLIILPQKMPTDKYRYECLIDDNTSMTEVYNRYDVVEQRGDIWLLEDKE